MGRYKLPKEKKKVLIGASIEKGIVEELTLLECKRIAEEAVLKEYYKKGISGIYKITNPVNECYIGGSKNISRRIKNHKSMHNINSKMKNSFEIYGVDKHTFEIIEECPINELSIKENFYQLQFNSIEKGLNLILTKPYSKRNFE
jgi:predicted GIY-YIG superfamily endonuclease